MNAPHFCPAPRLLLLPVLLLLSFIQPLIAQTTWTGATGADWNTPGNWSAGVPDANTDVIIAGVTTNPMLSTAGAVARSITVQSGGLLTIGPSGSLTINGAAIQGILNQGTIENSGQLVIGNTANVGNYGIQNEGTINNNTGSQVQIDRGGTSPVYNKSGAVFTNNASIKIGSITSAGGYGIYNFGTFYNNSGAQIQIDRASTYDLSNSGTFNNQGTISIGSLAGGNTVPYGLVNSSGPFNNLAGGTVTIDRVYQAIYAFSNTIANAGTFTVSSINPLIANQGSGVFSNNTGGIFKGSGAVTSSRFANNGGTVSPGYSAGTLSFNPGANFSNSILAIEINGAGSPGVQYDRINVTGTTIIGGTLALSINYNNPAPGDVFTILSTTTLAGEFSSVTGLPANWYVNYTPSSVIISYGLLPGTNQWTGSVNDDWQNAGNWSGGIPDAADDVVIPSTTNQPVIGTVAALAKSVLVRSGASLTVTAAGSLAINGSGSQGIWNKGTVQNSGQIRIGNTATTGAYGIYNDGAFSNLAGGQVTIDQAATSGIALLSNTFSNAGTLTIGQLIAMPNMMNAVAGQFSNNTGGILKGSGSLPAAFFTNAGGTLSPGYSPGIMSFDAAENFTNNLLAIEVNGPGGAGTDYDQVSLNGEAVLGGTLNVSISYTPATGDQVTILAASSISGTFATVNGLPANWNLVYYPTVVVLVYGNAATTWTGSLGTDWYKSGNWTHGVPDAASDVTIPDVANNPSITAPGARAKSVTIESGAQLTLTATGTLVINNGYAQAILNRGTVQNNGTLTIGNTGPAGSYGVRNEGIFNNNTGSHLLIDRGGTSPIYNLSGNTFTNDGTITIGANTSAGGYGIYNFGVFSNNTGAQVNIDRASTYDLSNSGTFNNQGTISIGSLAGGNTVPYGIVNSSGPFNNLAGGTVTINRVYQAIYAFSNTIANAGTFTVSSVNPLIANQGTGFFSNNTGGVFKGAGTITSSRFANNGGTLSPGYSPGILSFDGSSSSANSIMYMEVNSTGAAGVAYDQVAVAGTATLGGTLALTVSYATPVNDNSFTLVSATAISGTFSAVTGLPANYRLVYNANSVVLVYDDRTTWTGNINSDWNNAGNWNNGVPGVSKNAIIPNVATQPVISAAGAAVNTIHVQTGATLTITPAGGLTTYGRLLFNGISAGMYNQGTVNNGGSLTLN